MIKNRQLFIVGGAILIAGLGVWVGYKLRPAFYEPQDDSSIVSYDECLAAGYPILESYPEQCKLPDGKTFVHEIGNELEKSDLIQVVTPRPNEKVKSPLTIKGQARGTWFFEASFPVVLTNWDGLIIAQGIATAKGEWMTNDFVPFEATLVFTVDKNAYSNRGSLILRKDNPSDLPEHDDALEIPVLFDEVTGQ